MISALKYFATAPSDSLRSGVAIMIIRTIRHMIFAGAAVAMKTPRQPLNKGDKRARNRGVVCQGFRWIKIDHGK